MPTPARKQPDLTSLRAKAVARLLYLQEQKTLTHAHLRVTAESFDVHWRTVSRWMDNAHAHGGTYTPAGRNRFTLTPRMHDLLAVWCGNATAAYRELKARPHPDDPPLPSLATFQRAVVREIDGGTRAGLKGGEQARRRYDVHGKRERGNRNDAWETDHVEASVWVNVEGVPTKPWITWFIDCSTDCICGLAITPHTPSRQAVLTAIRDALLRGGDHSPFGGLPALVRVDRGKDFLSSVVDEAFSHFAVDVHALPARHPEWKGTVEALNGAIKKMHFPGMPGYSEEPIPKDGKIKTPVEDLLHFQDFVADVLDWVTWWNTSHTMPALGGRTPQQAWDDDLTPVWDVDAEALHTYTLERHGNPLTITTQGVKWNGGHYIADWMHGHAGDKVELRYMPHHLRTVELYDPTTGEHRGQAALSDQTTRAEKRELRRAWQRKAKHLTAQLKKANKNRKARYAATSRATDPEPTDTLTRAQADQQLHELTQYLEEPQQDEPPLLPLPTPTSSFSAPSSSPPTQPDRAALGLDDEANSTPPLPEPSATWTAPTPSKDTTEGDQA